MISWLSQTTLLKLPGPADLLYTILGRSGPFFQNMLHNSLFKLLFCPGWTIAMLSWQAPANSIKPLQLIQSVAARLIFNEPKRMHVTPLFISLHWLPIAACIKFKALMFAYKTTSGSAPLYLNSVLQTYVCPLEACVLQVNVALLFIPKRHKITFTDFYINCSLLTNSIPAAESLAIFKKRLKTHLFHLYLTL